MGSPSSDVPRLIKPHAVTPGDTVALVAPAFAIEPERVDAGQRVLEAAGFRVRRGRGLLAQRGYLAGSDGRRARELQAALESPKVDAILCVRGGYGCHRIMASLDPAAARAARKPLVGFSDVTTLLLWQRRLAGLVGVHGPMFDGRSGPSQDEVAALVHLLGGGVPEAMRGQGGRGRRAEGRLVGGSLTLLAASLGTAWEVDARGAILCFEEIGEKPYALDRMLQHLASAGKLEAAAGFAVGHLTGCTDPKRERPEAEAVVREILGATGKPFVLGLPFGHGSPNLPWPVGVRGWIDGGRAELGFSEPGVQRA